MNKFQTPRRRRAAALITAIIMALLLVAIAGASLSLVSTNRRLTDAHFTQHALMPVAERGLDQAMKVVNKYLKDNPTNTLGKLATQDFSGSWTADGWREFTNADAKLPNDTNTFCFIRDFGTIAVGDGHNCTLKVKVLNVPGINSDLPYRTYAIAEVTGPSYSRQFLAAYVANSGQTPGMVSMQLITFTGGNVFIAAYDSTKGGPSTWPDTSNLSSDVTVATFYAQDINLGQVNVYGYVSTIPKTEADFSTNGAHIWDVNSSTPYQKSGVDGYDSSGNLYDPVKNPAPTGLNPTPNIKDDFTLNPDDFTVKNSDDILAAVKANTGYTGSNLPPKIASNTITADNQGNIYIGNSKTPATTLDASLVSGGVYYMDSDITMKSTSPSLTIAGNVTLINNTPSNEFTVGGQGNILVKSAASSLSVYTQGDVSVGGNAVMGATDTTNLVSPRQFLVSGTNPTPGGQSITFNGNGAYIGTIYAPDANLYLKGGGSSGTVRGSIVAYTISANGVTNFYYDKNLATTSNIQYRLNSLTELVGAAKVSM